MKKEIIFYSVFIGFFGIVLISCIHDLPNAKDMTQVCFNADVLPIFQGSCAISGCHDSRSGTGGYTFDNYNSIMHAITPGDSKNSSAYQAIISKWVNAMPPDRPLSEEARSLIRIWIEQGAQNTTCASTTISTSPETNPIKNTSCFSNDIQPILSSSCATTSCHDSKSRQGGYNLSSYSLLMSSGLIRAGNGLGSKFYKVLVASGSDRMPRSPKLPLTSSQISLVVQWINEGATNGACANQCDTATYTYSGAIENLIVTNCKGCHSGPTPEKNVSLTNYNEVKAIALDSRILNVIKAANKFPQMPPSQKLSDCNIQQIEKWVKAGAPNN